MSIIQKLILKEWLTFFLGAVSILLTILSLGHMLSGLLSSHMELAILLKDLALESPSFLIKIFPVGCLIASLFSINKLKSRNELTAIFASGYSRSNFVVSICLAGSIAGLVLFFVNAYVVPEAKHQQEVLKNPTAANSVSINAHNSGKIWFKGLDYFFSYSSFNPRLNELNNLTIYQYDKNFKFTEQTSAPRAVYQNNNHWLMVNAVHSTNLDNHTFPDVKHYAKYQLTLNE
jgi:lipopolysaccharide export system permease protein